MWQLTVKVAVAAAGHEITKHVEWKQRVSELAEVKLQNASNRVDVFPIQLVQQRIFPYQQQGNRKHQNPIHFSAVTGESFK